MQRIGVSALTDDEMEMLGAFKGGYHVPQQHDVEQEMEFWKEDDILLSCVNRKQCVLKNDEENKNCYKFHAISKLVRHVSLWYRIQNRRKSEVRLLNQDISSI